jgi:hypothetical protein
MTHHRPKPWGKRARPDGSCKPKIRKIKRRRHMPIQIWIERIFFFLLFVLFTGVLGFYLYLQAARFGLLGIFGTSNSMNGLGVFLKSLYYINQVTLAIGVAWVYFNLRGIVRTRRRAIALRCLICPRCGYDLSQRVDDSQPCPECGQFISRRECRRLWCKALRG